MQKEKEVNNKHEHTLVYEGIDRVELVSKIMDRYRELGLNQIDFSKYCSLQKMSQKNRNPNGYPSAYRVIDGAVAQIIGNMDGAVWLYMFTEHLNGQWFKTSPVIRVEKLDPVDEYSIFQIETENSIYHLSQRTL
jgi:hypothetical protein